MALTHKRTERMVAEYLGGTRDWKEDHDCSVEGSHGECWIVECKSHHWRSGPGALWTLLDQAREQVVAAMEREGLTAEDYCFPLVVYWPTYCPQDGSALAYAPVGPGDEWVVMPLRRFRDLYCAQPGDPDDEC